MPANKNPRKRLQMSDANIRLSDVARLADCSTSTASRALSKPDMVTPEVRERVNAAVMRLGYTPNGAAKSLRSKHSHLIGVVIPTIDHSIFAQAVNSLENRLSQDSYSLLVTTSEFDLKRELLKTQLLVERGSEGVVLVGHLHDPKLYEFLQTRRVPYVNTYAYSPGSEHPFIGFDNRKATTQIAEFLFGLGHDDIGFISGFRKDNDRAGDRVGGVQDAYRAQGRELSPKRIVEEAYTIEGGRRGLRSLMAGGHGPTAVVCGSDILAFGALAECAAMGLNVPGDVSIVGFDDHEFAAHVRLTTMQVPALEMGRLAAEYLITRLSGRGPGESVEVPARLVQRDTTGVRKRA